MKKAKLKEVFKHKGKICVIVEMNMVLPIGQYHNGYVEIKKHKHYDELIDKINADELTFSGELDYLNKELKGKWFLGFDSVHGWNMQQPESQTFDSVKKRTIQLAEELIKLGE